MGSEPDAAEHVGERSLRQQTLASTLGSGDVCTLTLQDVVRGKANGGRDSKASFAAMLFEVSPNPMEVCPGDERDGQSDGFETVLSSIISR
jgi:hypothetical protein